MPSRSDCFLIFFFFFFFFFFFLFFFFSLSLSLMQGARDKKGAIPLHHAAYGDQYECARFLLSNGSKCTARDQAGLSPLHFASIRVSVSSWSEKKSGIVQPPPFIGVQSSFSSRLFFPCLTSSSISSCVFPCSGCFRCSDLRIPVCVWRVWYVCVSVFMICVCICVHMYICVCVCVCVCTCGSPSLLLLLSLACFRFRRATSK
jgi:Ankyrin repeats (3 copies)